MHLSFRIWMFLIPGLFLVFLPSIVRSQHWMHVVILAGLESILVVGFVAQYKVRLLTFCAATFWGMGAYISALLSKRWDLSFWLCLPFSGIGTALIAFLIGMLIVRAGWLTFLMISIVIAEIFVEALGHVSFLGGWDGVIGIPRPTVGSFAFVTKTSYYYLTLGLMAVCMTTFYTLYKSPIGRAWSAIGQSDDLAASVGINLYRYRMAAYVIAAFTAGLSGSLYAHYSGYLVPNTFNILRSIYVSISAVIGGLQFVIAGPIIGTFITKALPEFFRIADKYEPILVGIMIILCVFFFRKGLLGVLPKHNS